MVQGNYMRSAPIRRLRHPLEENPIWGILGSALAGILALVVGLPVLLVVCILIPFCLFGRWLLLFIFWNRQTSAATQGGGPESVRGNDGRWLGSAWRCSVIHAVLIFEAGAGLDVTHLRNLLLSRVIPLYPRLTRRPIPLPLSAGAGHCWLPDSQFCIDRHVFAGPSKLTTEKQLQDYVGHLLGEGLSNDKPPWELHVLQSVGHHQDTVTVLRVHQSVADGMALVRVLCHSLADCHVLHVPQRPHFGALAFTLNIFRACLVGPLTFLIWLLLTTEDCNILTQRKGWSDQVSVTWSAAIALPKVNRIKQVTRSTVNCVLLAALAGAARRLLQGCGVKNPPDMKIVLPVDLRADVTSPHLSSRLGNKLAPVVVGLPVGVEGAVPRLWAMRRNLDSLRTSADPVVVYVATAALMASIPGRVARKVLSFLNGKATLQFSSLPGPTSTLFVGGYPLKGVYPLLPAQNSLGLAVSVFTYVDQVYVAVISDSTLGPAARALLHNLQCQIELLWQLLLHRRVPGESRSHVLLRRTDVTGSPVRELRLRLTCVQEEVQRLATCQVPNQQQNVQNSESKGKEKQDAARLQNLKTEFSELLSELHRRNSAAVGGNSPLFEDEEVGGELWRPRRRAMSCSSSRYSSRSLVGLLSAARPASFIETYSSRSPANPSTSVAYRPTPNEHVLSGPIRPASYTDTHSTSICIGQDSPIFCRSATSECTLPGVVGYISPEELICNKDNPARPMEHMPATVSHLIQLPTFCDTNITVISEHPLEVRHSVYNVPHSSAGTDECDIKMNSSGTNNTRTECQNRYVDNDASDGNYKRGARTEDITCRCEPEGGICISSHISAVQSNSNSMTVTDIQNTIHSVNSSQTSNFDSSVKPSISSSCISSSIDLKGDEDTTSCRKSIFVNCPQYFPVISPKVNVIKYLKGSTNLTKSNAAHSTQTTNGDNKDVAVLRTQKEKLCSENMYAQNVVYNKPNAIAVKNSEYPTSCMLKGPIRHEGEQRLVDNLVYSTDLICSTPGMNAQYISPHLENIQNQEPYSVYDTTTIQDANDYSESTINHKTDMHLHATNILYGYDDAEGNHQKEGKHPVLKETTNLSSTSKSIFNLQNTKDCESHQKQDCVITLTKTCREKYKTPKDFIVTDYFMTEKDSHIGPYSVTSGLSLQTDTAGDTSVMELAGSPSSSVSNSTATTEQSVGYQILESPDTNSTVSLVSLKSACSSKSVTSTSSINTLNSSNTFPPSTFGSPVH